MTALVERLSPVWVERIGLTHFEIRHAFLDSYDGAGSTDDFHTTAVCETRWQYMQAKIKWYLPSAVRHDDEQLERTLVHELCHVLLSPEQTLLDVKLEKAVDGVPAEDADDLQDRYFERLELSTEMTARALLRAWPSALGTAVAAASL